MSQEGTKAPAVYPFEMKLQILKRVEAGEAVSALAKEFSIRRKNIYQWKDRYAEFGEAGLKVGRGKRTPKPAPTATDAPRPERGELLAARTRIAELERKVGIQALELDFFEEALQRIGVKDAKKSSR